MAYDMAPPDMKPLKNTRRVSDSTLEQMPTIKPDTPQTARESKVISAEPPRRNVGGIDGVGAKLVNPVYRMMGEKKVNAPANTLKSAISNNKRNMK